MAHCHGGCGGCGAEHHAGRDVALENNAVGQVLTTHNLPSTDAKAVLGWSRDDVRAQEWIDLSKIVSEPDASR